MRILQGPYRRFLHNMGFFLYNLVADFVVLALDTSWSTPSILFIVQSNFHRPRLYFKNVTPPPMVQSDEAPPPA